MKHDIELIFLQNVASSNVPYNISSKYNRVALKHLMGVLIGRGGSGTRVNMLKIYDTLYENISEILHYAQ